MSRSKQVWEILWKTHIRPHLEHAIQSWLPHLKGGIDLLESVQRAVTKHIGSMKGEWHPSQLTYEVSLQATRTHPDLTSGCAASQPPSWHHERQDGQLIWERIGQAYKSTVLRHSLSHKRKKSSVFLSVCRTLCSLTTIIERKCFFLTTRYSVCIYLGQSKSNVIWKKKREDFVFF